ncbi:MAG TPA: pilus assembly protein N-terminal domain-containing protein [Myxococcaceae bacterium]|jgi:pilus assembly protein CpaC
MKALIRGTLVALTLVAIPTLADPAQAPAAAPAANAEEVLTLQAGTLKTLTVPGITRIALGDPDIADVELTGGDALRIDGRKAGETKLLIWTGSVRKAYRIVVVQK